MKEDEITLKAIQDIIEDETLEDHIKVIGMGHYLITKLTIEYRERYPEDWLAVGIARGLKDIINRKKEEDMVLGLDLEETITRMLIE